MSSDDRDDPPRGNRRPISQPQSAHWDDDRRATVGRRRVHTAVRGTTIGGVPVVLTQQAEVDERDPAEHEPADRTPVFHLVDAPLTEQQAHDLIAWVKRIARKLEDASSDEKRNMSELRKLMAQPPPAAIVGLQASIAALQAQVDELRARPAFAVVDRLDRVDRDLAELREVIDGTKDQPGVVARLNDHDTVVKPTRSLARAALGGVGAALIAIVVFVYARGASEQHVTDEIQALRHQSEQLERQVDRLPPPAAIAALQAQVDRLQSQLQNQKDSRP